MTTLLYIESSSAGSESVSRAAANAFLEEWRGAVVHRDLGANPVPFITAAHVVARRTDPTALTPELKEATALQDELIEEFLAADAYLFTVPMYNYSAPAAFKAWIDQIVVLNRTLAFPPPTAGRPAVVVSARGGEYAPGSANHERDFVLPWLKLILGDTLGLDVRFITPEMALAATTPAMAALIPVYEQSLDAARGQARNQAQALIATHVA